MKHIKHFIILSLLFICSNYCYSQVTIGARFSGHNGYFLDYNADANDAASSLSSTGGGLFVGLESKRFITQLGYNIYAKTHNLNYKSTNYEQGVELKPSELGINFGYKINANHPLKIYPFLGLTKYTINLKYKETSGNSTLTIEDQNNFFGAALGLGSYYEYNNIVFDLQTKLAIQGSDGMAAVNIFFGFGVGYKFKQKEAVSVKE